MADLTGFDAEKVEPNTGMDPVPAGDYLAVAVESEFKPTRDNKGEYLQFTWEVIDGPYRGKRLWDRLNLKNANDTAVKIAQATLSSICRAVGVLRPRDSSELHNKPVRVKVTLEERDDKKGVFKNEIKGYEPANAPAKAGGPAASQAANSTADESVPPWKRKSA